MSRSRSSGAQILLFPTDRSGEVTEEVSISSDSALEWAAPVPVRPRPLALCDAVISGTFRKDPVGLGLTYQELQDLGCRILSPKNAKVVSEEDGFVYMHGEQAEKPEAIESRHLEAIQRSQFVWLFAPDGYVGPSAALEVGFARAAGIPIYSRNAPSDSILRSFVSVVSSPVDIAADLRSGTGHVPQPALQAFQTYYRRAAIQRGYDKETAQNCLLLMVEEVGELARALRKREGLKRHGKAIAEQEALELADVFMYVVHLANVLGLDLSKAVRDKELLNIHKISAAVK